MASGRRFVFLDPSGKRARVLIVVTMISAVLLTAMLAAIVAGVFSRPDWSTLSADGNLQPHFEQVAVGATSERRVGTSFAALGGTKNLARYAFMNPATLESWLSLSAHSQHIDTLFLDAIDIDPASPSDPLREHVRIDEWRAEIARRTGDVPVVAVLGNRSSNGGIGSNLLQGNARQALIVDLVDRAAKRRYAGYLLDHVLLADVSPTAALRFVAELRAALATDDRKLYFRLSGELFDTPTADPARFADYVIVDVHRSATTGAPASQARVEDAIRLALRRVPAERLILAMGAFARHASRDGIVEIRPVQYAWQVAHLTGASVGFDTRALNSTFTIRGDDDEGLESFWLLDAVSGFNHATTARGARLAGVAIDQLGFEDPGIWSVFDLNKNDSETLAAISFPRAGVGGLNAHNGALVAFRPGTEGERALSFDERRGLIVDALVSRPPLQFDASTFTPQGENMVALTFDDGPDPIHTPRILEILSALDVKATFYVVGAQVVAHPSVVRRIVVEGHDVGNHSFTHANLTDAGRDRIMAELNATQRVLEAATGVSSILFRPPFSGHDLGFLEASPQLVEQVSDLGYVFGPYNVNSVDFLVDGDWIARRVVEDVKRTENAIVLLHDGGGNRTATIEALPRIIEEVRAAGYRFVSTHELVGLPREALMPTTQARSNPLLGNLRAASLTVFGPVVANLPWIAVMVALVGICRLVFVLALSKPQPLIAGMRAARHPRVAVIVPAYNEEAGIVATVDSLLASRMSETIRVIVVDDGSSDATSARVMAEFNEDPRVVLIRKQNGGKSSALNAGFEAATEEIVVAIDGDTVVDPDGIKRLIAPFADPNVGAVAGKIIVGSPRGLLSQFQALEYAIAQNVERHAFERLNAVAVVPGAFGAWRREAVVANGGYTTETLAEDADLTWALQIGGWRVVSRNDAVAYTEAPESLRDFLKQRFRWTFGNLQVSTKHLLHGHWNNLRTRAILVTNVYFFQFAMALFAPLVDILVLFSLFSLAIGSVGFDSAVLLIVSFAIFQSLDIFVATIALRREGRRLNVSILLLLILQRFCYRQLLYYVALKSLLAAARGGLIGWGNLARRGLFGRSAASASQ